jgi:hypothetical protein
LHVQGSLLGRGVTVTLDRSALPAGTSLTGNRVASAEQVRPGGADPFPFSRAHGVAWLLNSSLLWAMWLVLLLVQRSRAVLPQELMAGPQDESSWYTTMRVSFAIGLLDSWVIIDLVKVACLTLTCNAALARFGLALEAPRDANHVRGEKDCAKRITSCLRKPLRRAHKALDALL